MDHSYYVLSWKVSILLTLKYYLEVKRKKKVNVCVIIAPSKFLITINTNVKHRFMAPFWRP